MNSMTSCYSVSFLGTHQKRKRSDSRSESQTHKSNKMRCIENSRSVSTDINTSVQNYKNQPVNTNLDNNGVDSLRKELSDKKFANNDNITNNDRVVKININRSTHNVGSVKSAESYQNSNLPNGRIKTLKNYKIDNNRSNRCYNSNKSFNSEESEGNSNKSCNSCNNSCNSNSYLSKLSSLSQESSSDNSSMAVKHFKFKLNHLLNEKYLVSIIK